MARGVAHPVRPFPGRGVRVGRDPGLFWSPAFAIRKARFMALGGFDAGFVGCGGEDTDFGFRADRAGLRLLFVGGAIACHQHHESHDTPVQHLDAIVRNARRFHARWGAWPMQGWLAQFAAMGLLGVARRDSRNHPLANRTRNRRDPNAGGRMPNKRC